MTVIEVEMKKFAKAEFNRWFDEEHIPLLARAPGWVRSRRFVLKEVLGVEATESDQEAIAGETDTETESETDSDNGSGSSGELERRPVWERGVRAHPDRRECPPKFLAIHEWASLDAFETKQYRRATTTPWRTEVLKDGRVLRYEIRVFRAS